jgi:excisionase family DNA binding protein
VVIVVEGPDFFTVEEAGRILRIGRTTAYRLARMHLESGDHGGIPVIVVGGQFRVPRAALERLAGGPVHPPAAAAAAVAGATNRDRRHAGATG